MKKGEAQDLEHIYEIEDHQHCRLGFRKKASHVSLSFK
jgi:hypothetical protein